MQRPRRGRAFLRLQMQREVHALADVRRVQRAIEAARRRHGINLFQAEGFVAFHRIHRLAAGDAAIQRGADRIDIRGRANDTVARILLNRRIAARERDATGFHLAVALARRAEINQHRLTAAPQVDVVGLDVEMQHPGLVHRLQPR